MNELKDQSDKFLSQILIYNLQTPTKTIKNEINIFTFHVSCIFIAFLIYIKYITFIILYLSSKETSNVQISEL